MRPILAVCGLLLVGCPKKSDQPAKLDPAPRRDAGAAVVPDVGRGVTLPPAPPLPAVPAGLPRLPDRTGDSIQVTPEAVALGELLFFDPRLSSTGELACAGCHVPDAHFAGATRQATATGKPNLRRAPTLENLAWHTEYGWDGRYRTLPEHLEAHVRGQLGEEIAASIGRLLELPGYRAHVARLGSDADAAGGGAARRPGRAAINALAAYSLTRYAGDAPWDRLERAPTVPADIADIADIRAGYQLFSGKAQCSLCHPPPLYTDLGYHRLGLIAIPDEGRGRMDTAQQGAFKTPTLRGAARGTGFFHDGGASSLEAAIDWHLAGGVGQGADPSIVAPSLHKIALTPAERTQLAAFVRALTDQAAPAPRPPALP